MKRLRERMGDLIEKLTILIFVVIPFIIYIINRKK